VRNPEHRHHRIANELLHRSTVALNDRPQLLEIAAHHTVQRLRIKLLTQGRRARYVAEKRCDNLARLSPR
jgi:hypothetical protein